MNARSRTVLERLGLVLAGATVLLAAAATQWPFHYQVTRFAISRRWARADLRWFPRDHLGHVRLDRDFALNLLMLIPLGVGFGLWRRATRLRGTVEGLALGIGVSTVLELAQLITPNRYTSFADVWRNALGCAIGCWVAMSFVRDASSRSR